MRMVLQRRKSRGNLLAMALASLAVLMTVVIAMHTSQSRAARNVTQAEGELQFRQASEFAIADLLFGSVEPPGSLKVRADANLVGDLAMPNKYADKLWTGLPDWNATPDLAFAPGHRTYKLEPSTSDQALKVFAGRFLWMVSQDSVGYAAYAPNGQITLEEATGWANPDDKFEKETTEAYSGAPLMLASKGKLEVGKMPYGSAHSLDGPLDLGDDPQMLGLPFQGPLPLRAYETTLKAKLDQARAALESAASSGNKTSEISGGTPANAGGVLDMLTTGDSGKLNLSLKQATSFPLPAVPSFTEVVPGVFFDLAYHMPFFPDLTSTGTFDETAGAKNAEALVEANAQVLARQAEIIARRSALTRLEIQLSNARSAVERARLRREISELNVQAAQLEERPGILRRRLQDFAADQNLQLQRGLRPKDAPQARAEDANIPKTGVQGWSYGKLFRDILEFLVTDDSLDSRKHVAEGLADNARLVHFGAKDDGNPRFRFDDGFFCRATFTVPRGRPFKLNGNMEIVGDLWLQKGSVMHVTGDLVLSNPDSGAPGPLQPSGKLILEEGATLIVDGDFDCDGDPRFGSIWVCTPPGKVAPVTSAIFVGGAVTLPCGALSASNLEDAAQAIDGKEELSLRLRSLFTDLAPNLAKIDGPFYSRRPYLASFASSYQLSLDSSPLTAPVPLPRENLLVPVFRSLTLAYTGSLNGALGENLFTHADWWSFGEGVVPAVIKLDRPPNSIKDLSLDGLELDRDWEDDVNELASDVLRGAAQFAVDEVGKTLVGAAVAPGGSLIASMPEDIMNALSVKESESEQLRSEALTALGSNGGQLETMKRRLNDEIVAGLSQAQMREVGGPLIYADSISVGDKAARPRMMSGMLVAENNIDVQTESFVGSLTSFNGNISAGKVYFTPAFSRASLYRPKSTATETLERTLQSEYGHRFDSADAVDVATGVQRVTSEGWSR